MRSPFTIVAGWLLALPGLTMLLSLLLVETPVFGFVGCRTAGILSIRCSNDIVGAVMEFFWIVLLVSASFIPISAVLLLFTLGFVGWRAWERRRARAR